MLTAVNCTGGGSIPEFPSGTVAVGSGLYPTHEGVVPPFRVCAVDKILELATLTFFRDGPAT